MNTPGVYAALRARLAAAHYTRAGRDAPFQNAADGLVVVIAPGWLTAMCRRAPSDELAGPWTLRHPAAPDGAREWGFDFPLATLEAPELADEYGCEPLVDAVLSWMRTAAAGFAALGAWTAPDPAEVARWLGGDLTVRVGRLLRTGRVEGAPHRLRLSCALASRALADVGPARRAALLAALARVQAGMRMVHVDAAGPGLAVAADLSGAPAALLPGLAARAWAAVVYAVGASLELVDLLEDVSDPAQRSVGSEVETQERRVT